jgi:hypothetical protein
MIRQVTNSERIEAGPREFRALLHPAAAPASPAPQPERSWDAWQAGRYQRGEISQRSGYTGTPKPGH